MRRMAHGFADTSEEEAAANAVLWGLNSLLPANAAPVSTPFDYMLAETGNPLDLLPEETATLKFLSALGATMRDPGDNALFDSDVPSAYTYFGQFVDHDITFTDTPKDKELSHSSVLGAEDLAPWSRKDVCEKVTNKRNSILQLDCVYGKDLDGNEPPHEGAYLDLGSVSPDHKFARIKDKDDKNDLPRHPRSQQKTDRVAKIADPRNDQNLVISQLHLAFLRAHNATVDYLRANEPVAPDKEFAEAQKRLRQHYHWIVIEDFLKQQLAYPGVVDEVLDDADPTYPSSGRFFLPLEFTIAAFRFGHAMIRRKYYLNSEYSVRSLTRMFTLAALSNTLEPPAGKGFDTLPWSKIIQWRRFLAGAQNKNRARQINTRLVEPLFALLDEKELPIPGERSLAVQDLKRGYMMRMPTGQAAARAFGLPEISENDLARVAVRNKQKDLLSGTEFSRRTPLWFYLLAEADHYSHEGKHGNRLGPVGSRLIAEVLIGLIRRSDDSILDPNLTTPWRPYLGSTQGKFDLQDLLQFAGVLEP